jgi:hypothetical protein
MRARPVWVNRVAHRAMTHGKERCLRASRCAQLESCLGVTIRLDSGEQISHDLVDETVTMGRSPDNFIRLEDISVWDQTR